ncbi:MAG TPA: TonB family protein [Vicinamibacteria bacterium]|jgi:TonB family protein
MLVHPRNAVLSSHFDGELRPAAAANVERHLSLCDDCRTEYERISETANAIRHLPAMRAPGSLVKSIRERIDSEERGMVPVLRAHILGTGNHSGFFPAVSLGTLATLALLSGILLLDYHYGEQAARRISSALMPLTPLPEPVLLHEPMSSPRFRAGSVNSFPYADVERGKEGEMFGFFSIDQNGTVKDLEVIYRSGDEGMITRTLQAMRNTGFEPARLGDRNVPVKFLYFFTTTEVRAAAVRRLSTQDGMTAPRRRA